MQNPSSNQAPQQSQSQFKEQTFFKVNKKGFIEAEGIVEELLPSATFKVILKNGYQIIAHLAGKMRLHKIMLVPGDKVKVEMSQYDLTKGRITYRL